jgi:hypothetical protein
MFCQASLRNKFKSWEDTLRILTIVPQRKESLNQWRRNPNKDVRERCGRKADKWNTLEKMLSWDLLHLIILLVKYYGKAVVNFFVLQSKAYKVVHEPKDTEQWSMSWEKLLGPRGLWGKAHPQSSYTKPNSNSVTYNMTLLHAVLHLSFLLKNRC